MSGNDGMKLSSGQALEFEEDDDQSGVPTAPMKAIPASAAAPRRPKPSINEMFDDDDDDDLRIGSKDHPYTTTEHTVFEIDAETAARVSAVAKRKGPNLVMVAVRILVILLVLGGLGFLSYRAWQGQLP